MNILIIKESREGEKRVSLVPADAYQLIQDGFNVFVEDKAGIGAGYDNSAYEAVGAQICKLPNHSVETYQSFFQQMDIIIRAKRPHRLREKLENKAIKPGTKMIGSLEPLEKNSEHINEYIKAGIDYFSFDQFYFPPNSPMDAIKKMSFFAGKLAVEDAIQKNQATVKKAVILGYGEAGQSAYRECLCRGISCTVITSQQHKKEQIQLQGGKAVYLNREIPLLIRQEYIKNLIKDVDIIIAAASSNGVSAPILIPRTALLELKPHTVIVDLAVSEGGNVEGSQADSTYILDKQICLTNTSGYPKAIPVEASIEWSKASYYFVNMLIKTPELLTRR